MNATLSPVDASPVAPASTALLALHLVRITLESRARALARALGVNRPVPLRLEDLAAPGTPLAREATEWGEDVCPALLLDHGRRGFLFADAIARHRGWTVDREVLYLGCLLHDLGLAPRFDRGGAFERDGADAAAEFLSRRGLSGARLRLVREVIELHDAVHCAHRASLETRLGHFGIGVDVIGYGVEDVDPGTIRAIVGAWPRGAFRTGFAAVLDDQATRKPDSHIAKLVRLGLGAKIRGAPIPDGP
jgi:hypothetical protein